MPHVVVIANPASAVLRGGGLEDLRREVCYHLDARGWDAADLLETDPHERGAGVARNAVAAGADLVLVAGGDTTVRTVAETLAGTGVALGVLPTGTDNTLARSLGVPLDVSAAIATALDGDQVPLDLGRLDDGAGTFAVMAEIGAPVAVLPPARDTADRPGWPGYVLADPDDVRGRGFAVEISLDGRPAERTQALGVLVGNVDRVDGRLPLLPHSADEDGLLDVHVLVPRTTRARVGARARTLLHRAPVDDDTRWEHWQARRVIIRAAEHQPRRLDGTPISASSALDASVVPGAVLVRVPGGAALPPRVADLATAARR